jgi:imidazole glycerol-phosphate synthase subunit HisH
VPKIKVIIVDYGLGNIFSIQRAIRHVGGDPLITADHREIEKADRIILPGVGAFGDGMKGLKGKGLDKILAGCARSGQMIFGICLGMQLLMTSSEEFGLHQGLDLISGKVIRFPDPAKNGPQYKIPHVGWNGISPAGGKNVRETWAGTILAKSSPDEFFYFVHSYRVIPDESGHVLATTEYGGARYCSVVKQGNVFGCQFHPELSGESGLNLYREFVQGGKNV